MLCKLKAVLWSSRQQWAWVRTGLEFWRDSVFRADFPPPQPLHSPNYPSPSACVEALNASASKCDCIWRHGDYVKMRPPEWDPTGVLRRQTANSGADTKE